MIKKLKYLLIAIVATASFISFLPRGFVRAGDPTSSTQNTEATATEDNQRKLIQSVPIPQFETSQERKNLVRRLTTFNKEDKISYIYLINYGKVMAFYTVKGKISSVSSYLTTTDQLVNGTGGKCDSNYNQNCYVMESPDLDGSYGTNGDAIFFFTTEDAYVEWKGDYMVSDQPLKLTTQPELIREIK